MEKLSVRQLKICDFEKIVDYFLNADNDFLFMMGVDLTKLPSKEDWLKLLSEEYQKPIKYKSFFYIIWELNGTPVGHSNINKINFGEEAHMHLHLWRDITRQKGVGFEFIKMSLPYYFDNFKLQRLYCEPYALNPEPNKILKKLGFNFIKNYDTTPGWINFHQSVNRWCLDYEKYKMGEGNYQHTYKK